MNEIRITSPARIQPATVVATTSASRGWQVGQVLKAQVLPSTSSEQVMLKIDNVLLQAKTSSDLRPGESIQLQVAASGPQPVLRIVKPDLLVDELAQLFKQALPRQGTMQPLLRDLGALLQTGMQQPGGIPASILQIGKTILANLPSLAQVTTASGLQQALQNSGTFLESMLADPRAFGWDPVSRDLKAGLLKLAGLIRGLQGENKSADSDPVLSRLLSDLSANTEGAIARLHVNQAKSLAAETGSQGLWLVDLPVRDDNGVVVLHLRINRDRDQQNPQEEMPWSVWLDFDLETLGSVRALVKVGDEKATIGFWAERESTTDLMNRHLGALRDDLQRAGVNTGEINCLHGISAPISDRIPVNSLVDEHA